MARIAVYRSVSVIAALLLWRGEALGKCVDDWLAIDEVRDGDRVALRASNRQQFPITFAIRVRSDAIQSRRGKTVTGTLGSEESTQVMVLPGIREGGAPSVRISCSWTIGDDAARHDDDHLYRLPYASGRSYRVLQGFGSRFSHRGIEQYAVDFKMAEGTPVHAARGGVVARVVEEHDIGCWEDGCGRYANFIVVLHDDGTTGEYYHLQQDGALVDAGEVVVAGQHIGYSGNTGHTTMPHLHFAVYRATKGARPQSVPISFISADGVVYEPRRGHHYLAVESRQAGD